MIRIAENGEEIGPDETILQKQNRSLPEIKATTSQPKFKVSGNRNSGASFLVSTEFINYTGKDIYLKTQNNMVVVLEASSEHNRIETPQKCLEIRMKYRLSARNSNAATKELIDSLLSSGEIVSEASKELRNQIIAQSSTSSHRGNLETHTEVTQRITVAEMQAAKAMYIRSCDTVVSERRELALKPHPNSDEGFHQLNVQNARDYHGVSGVFIRIIDNERLLPSRFCYSAKQVIEIPSEVNLNQQSGVYVTTAGVINGRLKTTSHFMSFSEAQDEFGVYETYGEAESNGNPERIADAKLRESELEISRLKIEASKRDADLVRQRQELELEKQILERDRQLRENELATIRHDLKIREHELESLASARDQKALLIKDTIDDSAYRRKDYYERRSTKRKDKSDKRSTEMKLALDVLKYAPAIVIGAYGVYKAIEFTRQ